MAFWWVRIKLGILTCQRLYSQQYLGKMSTVRQAVSNLNGAYRNNNRLISVWGNNEWFWGGKSGAELRPYLPAKGRDTPMLSREQPQKVASFGRMSV
jgi:hypothetical protein